MIQLGLGWGCGVRIREGFPEDALPGGHYIDCANELLPRMLGCTQISPSVKQAYWSQGGFLFICILPFWVGWWDTSPTCL